MLSRIRTNTSTAALVIALIALFVAIGGVAGALPGKNTVNSGDIKKNGVKSIDLKDDGVTGKDVKESTLDIPATALPPKHVYGFTWFGSPTRSTLPGVQVQQTSSNTFSYTFPFDVTQCVPVVSGIFESGFVALQSGTAPENRNKISVNSFTGAGTDDHNLVVVCP
jgi:hypothetical protein